MTSSLFLIHKTDMLIVVKGGGVSGAGIVVAQSSFCLLPAQIICHSLYNVNLYYHHYLIISVKRPGRVCRVMTREESSQLLILDRKVIVTLAMICSSSSTSSGEHRSGNR